MDSIIRRAFSPFAAAWRVIVLTLIICATGSAWAAAPTPTVMWDGDFSSLSKTVGDVTYSINNIGAGTDNTAANILASDNSYLQVVNSNNGYAVPTITATGGSAPFGSPENGATVIAFFREMPITESANRAVLSLLSEAVTFNNCHVNVGVCRYGNAGGGNTAGSFTNGGQWDGGAITPQVFSGGEQMIAFTCKSGDGMAYYVNGRQIATSDYNVTFTPTGVCLGGMDNSGSGKFYAMKNMKILGVAIFDRKLTAEEVAEFSFDKWDTSNKWRYNDTLAYREPTTGTVSDFAYATVAMVGSDGVADTGTFALNSPSHHPYTVLNEPNANYVSPGVALVFDKAGYKAPPAPNFGDLILGGLHVTANRAEGTPYALNSSTGGARTTALGDKNGNRESYFVFDESFSISRQGNQNTANSKLYGVVNIEVASGKTFSLNGNGETGNGATIVMTTAGTTAPVLKMVGGGKFKVGTLNASSGTLDFSGVTDGPFIQGGLTVSAATKLVLPAGTAEDTAYVLNSTGTLTAPAVVQNATVQIGSGTEQQVILLYDTANNSVKYYTSFPEYNGTVSGSTITWDTEPTVEQMQVGIVNLTGSGEVTLATEPVALNVGSGVTVDVTGYTSASLAGSGTFKYTSGYPTSVPSGMTYQYVGGDSAESASTVSGTLSVSGTLKTSGFININSYWAATTVATLDVVSGTTSLNCNDQAIAGYITVRSGATLVNQREADAIVYSTYSTTVNVYGTLSMGNTRWTLWGDDSKRAVINVHGGTITGAGQSSNGALDFIGTSQLNADETSTISAAVRFRNSLTPVTVASDKTLTLSGSIYGSGSNGEIGGVTKNGAGNLTFTSSPNFPRGIVHNDGGLVFETESDVALTTTYTSLPSDTTSLWYARQSNWKGRVVVNALSNDSDAKQVKLQDWGNANSYVTLNGLSGNYWIANNDFTVQPEIKLGGNVDFNNGSSGKTVTFRKIADGSGNLSLSTWSGIQSSGITYGFTTVDSDHYTGTIQLSGSLLTFNVGDILKTSPTGGTRLVNLTRANSANVNLSGATLNGASTDLVVGTDGIYLAAASYGGVNYPTVDAAITVAGDDNLASITILNGASAPEGYALVGTTGIRKAGGEIYWAAANSGDWSGEASNGTHTFYTAEGEVTPYLTGDTVVITNDVQIWTKTAAHGAKFQIGTDSVPATVSFSRSGEGCDNYILDGSEIEVKAGSTLVVERYASNSWDSYTATGGPAYSGIRATTVTGEGTVKFNTNVAGKLLANNTDSTSISCPIELASGATLEVPSTCSVSAPTTSVVDKDVAVSVVVTTKTYSVVDANSVKAAIIDTDGGAHKFEVAQNAFDYIDLFDYDYFAIYKGTDVEISIEPTKYSWSLLGRNVKIKCLNGSTVVVTLVSDEYALEDSEPVDGIVTYTQTNKATTYVWVGATSAAEETLSAKTWGSKQNWKVGSSSGAAASRYPSSVDTAVIEDGAYITSGITVSDSLTITGSGTLTSTAAIDLSSAGAYITVDGVTLDPTPTTSVADYVVRTTGGGDDPTVYTAVLGAAKIGSTPYETLAEALAVEGASVEISLLQNVTGDVALRPGQTLILNGKTVSGDIVGNEPGVEVIDYQNKHMFYVCVDNRTNSWIGTSGGTWGSAAGWYNGVVPGSDTAVTINSFATAGDPTTTGTIMLAANSSVKSITLGEGVALTLNKSGESAVTLTTTSAIVLTSGQSIVTGSGVSISPAITTEDANSYVKSVTSDGATTYTVAAHKATVYDAENAEVKKYDTVADAVSAATDGQKVTLFADSTEAITLNGKSITFNEGSYAFSGTFTGNGTLVLPEGTVLKSPGAARWAAGWTGTVWLKNYQELTGRAIEASAGVANFDPNDYGNSGSTVRFTKVKGYLTASTAGAYTIQPAIEIFDDGEEYGLTLYNGFGYNSSAKYYTKLKRLKGNGTLLGYGTGDNVLLTVEDWDDFSGTLTLTNKVVVFGTTLPTQSHIDYGGYVIVNSEKSVEVPAGKIWTLGKGVVVDGNLSLGAGASIVNTTAANTWLKRGTGTVTLNSPSDLVGTPDANWTGTVVLKPFDGSSGIKLATYGTSSDATIVVKGMSAGWLDSYGDAVGGYTASRCPATLQLDGAMNVTGMSSDWHYIFSKITGTGSISFPSEGSARELTITTLEVPQGTSGVAVTNNTSTTLNIGTLALPEGADVSAGAKILTTYGSIAIDSITVGDVSRAFALDYRADGVYVCAATLTHGETVTPYASAQAAFNAIQDLADIITVYVEGETIAMPVMWNGMSAKIAAANGVTVTVQGPSGEYAVTPSAGEGYTSYTLGPAATIYVWVGATNSEASYSDKNFGRLANWKVGASDGETAKRSPGSGDIVKILDTGAYVSGITVSGSLIMIGNGSLASSGAIELSDGATLSVSGVTISPRPTTNVAHSRVIAADGTVTIGEEDVDATIYSVAVIPGTIFSVY